MNDDIQRISGELIAKLRRIPSKCLYCDRTADSNEHIVPEAIGGRLAAPILCREHNSIVNAADQPLSKNFAPFVNMLQVPRHRGGTGAEFDAIDALGKTIKILAEGFAKEKSLEVHAKDQNNRISYATGDLARLDALPTEALSDLGSRIIIATISNPEAEYMVESTDIIFGGVLKIAMHFIAGFVADVPYELACEMLSFILGENRAAGTHVRTPFLDEDMYPESWPPRHEVTAYPYGDDTYVTVLLFGAYAYECKFPIRMAGTTGVRYRQTLSVKYPEIYENVSRPNSLKWDSQPEPDDKEKWFEPIEKRLKRLHYYNLQFAYHVRFERAWNKACTESSNFGDIWTRYKAALQMEALSAYIVERAVSIGHFLSTQGKDPWDVPISFEEDSV